MAGHLSKRVGRGDMFVLADETWETFDTSPYRKISHNVDFAAMGLDVGYPAKESYLWYNGDFPLYKAVINFPMYDYYCMVDYDALINHPLDALIDKMDSDQIEFVGYRLRGAPEPIARNVRGHFRNTNSLLPCILIASHRVVKYLYQTRRRIAEVYRDHKELGWPFIEGFLGAAITDRSDIVTLISGDWRCQQIRILATQTLQ